MERLWTGHQLHVGDPRQPFTSEANEEVFDVAFSFAPAPDGAAAFREALTGSEKTLTNPIGALRFRSRVLFAVRLARHVENALHTLNYTEDDVPPEVLFACCDAANKDVFRHEDLDLSNDDGAVAATVMHTWWFFRNSFGALSDFYAARNSATDDVIDATGVTTEILDALPASSVEVFDGFTVITLR